MAGKLCRRDILDSVCREWRPAGSMQLNHRWTPRHTDAAVLVPQRSTHLMSSHLCRSTMKKLLMLTLVCLASVGCSSAPKTEEKIVVTTPTGRNVSTTRRYTLEEIEAGSVAPSVAKSLFDIEHPVYPDKDGLADLKQHLGRTGEVWYFQGLDSGWAVVKNRKVIWVLVTSHEY